MIPASVLRGMPYSKAKCFGMPHHMAFYTSGDRHSLQAGATCLVCGRPAESAHHEPQKGMGGQTWTLRTPKGAFVLRPALIALCGSGTTGCHGKRHSGLLRIEWVWDDPAWEEAWFSGEVLSMGVRPHSPELLGFGHWEASHA